MKDQRSQQQISNDVKEQRNFDDTFHRENQKLESEMQEHMEAHQHGLKTDWEAGLQDFKEVESEKRKRDIKNAIKALKSNIDLGRVLIDLKRFQNKDVNENFRRQTEKNIETWQKRIQELENET